LVPAVLPAKVRSSLISASSASRSIPPCSDTH
jgi:hypothetical protein